MLSLKIGGTNVESATMNSETIEESNSQGKYHTEPTVRQTKNNS